MSHTEEPFHLPLQRNQCMLYDNSLSSVMFLFHSGNVTKQFANSATASQFCVMVLCWKFCLFGVRFLLVCCFHLFGFVLVVCCFLICLGFWCYCCWGLVGFS